MNVACVGDCGVDRYVPLGLDRAGGITLNVAVHLRQCVPDAHVTVCSPLGDDRGARIVTDAIARAGLDARIRHLRGQTPIQYIDLEPDGEKRFIEYQAGVLRDYRLGPEERDVIDASDLLVTTVFAQVEALFDSVMALPSRGLRAVDFTNLSDVTDGVGLVGQYAGRLDVAFFGLSSGEGDLIDTLEEIARSNGRLFVVTLGRDGSMALGGSDRIVRSARLVPKVVDTTGAGDSFAAAFLAEYCETRDIERALARGSDNAARTIQHVGGFILDPDDRVR
jgi:fructoselysine 6-kinase